MLAARILPSFFLIAVTTSSVAACHGNAIHSPASTTGFTYASSDSPDATADRAATTATSTAPATTTTSAALEPMTTEPAAPAPASVQPCASLAWSRTEPPHAKVANLVGKLTDARAENAAGAWERYFVLELERPVCDSDGKGQRELQVAPGKAVALEAIAALSGRRVQIEGDASEVQTREDHLPVVVRVRSVRTR